MADAPRARSATPPLRLALVQMSMRDDRAANLATAEAMVREAAAGGARLILLPELFEYLYWPQVEREDYFALAQPVEGHPFLPRFQALAAELGVVLPVSFFERANQAHFNSLMMIDADGSALGLYRKSHIPDGPGYEEKYYFNPGDTGFKAWRTAMGVIGVGICWDQWFPECARAMALQGAEVLLYPTAIGSEPEEAGGFDTSAMWQRAMLGHAVANACYVGAANRVGVEGDAAFYGSSFVADPSGETLAAADRNAETIVYADLDLHAARAFRAGFGFFRDRRPELYRPLLTLDGVER